jgi:FtsZ-binding cell division protein ZapB
MKERGDRFEADLATVRAELETSKAQNVSLQQQLDALTIRAEALETQSLATRPSAPMAQPENVDVVSVTTNLELGLKRVQAGLSAQISQLRTEKAALEVENNSLKEQVTRPLAQSSPAPQVQPGPDLQAELNNLRQQNEGLTKNMREMAGKLNVRAIVSLT